MLEVILAILFAIGIVAWYILYIAFQNTYPSMEQYYGRLGALWRSKGFLAVWMLVTLGVLSIIVHWILVIID